MQQRPADRPAWWKTLLLCLVVVPLFFLLLEVVLWAAGVPTLLAERDPFLGFSRRVRVFQEDRQRGVLFTPPRAVRQSFNQQQFLIDKPAEGFRLFVLGGSSAKGFPWGARTAFPAVLGDALRASWPGRAIESVNAAAMSYGSHRLRVLAHELIGYEPDALVVYEGHNEFVESRFYREVLERRERLDAARQLLHQWRLYSLMTRMAETLRPATEPAVADRTPGELLGLDVAREDATETDLQEKERVRARFEENLRATVDLAEGAGVPIVLCTVASNVRDWAPNQSLFDPAAGAAERAAVQTRLDRGTRLLQAGEAAEAAAEMERAQALAPGHALIAYRLAQAYEAQERWDESRQAYARARDLDAQPARALTSINETVRRVARERGTALVDVERVFEQHSPHGLVGFNLTEDYVHPKPEGHRLIALALWATFNERGLLGERRSSAEGEFWAAVGHAPLGGVAALADPAGPQGESPTAAYLYNLAVVLEHQGLSDQAIQKYSACLDLDPAYGAAAFNLGLILNARGRWAEAAARFQQALRADPDDGSSLNSLGLAQAKLGLGEEAVGTLRRATRIEPDSPMAWSNLGYVLSLQGSGTEAIAALRKAVELAPQHPIPMSNLGSALRRVGEVDEAIRWLRASLAVRSDLAEARHALAESLLSKGDLAEAEEQYRQCLAANPNDAVAAAGLTRLRARGAQP